MGSARVIRCAYCGRKELGQRDRDQHECSPKTLRKRVAELKVERDALLDAAKDVVDAVDEVIHPDAAHSDVDLCDIRGTLSRAIAKAEFRKRRDLSDE